MPQALRSKSACCHKSILQSEVGSHGLYLFCSSVSQRLVLQPRARPFLRRIRGKGHTHTQDSNTHTHTRTHTKHSCSYAPKPRQCCIARPGVRSERIFEDICSHTFTHTRKHPTQHVKTRIKSSSTRTQDTHTTHLQLLHTRHTHTCVRPPPHTHTRAPNTTSKNTKQDLKHTTHAHLCTPPHTRTHALLPLAVGPGV